MSADSVRCKVDAMSQGQTSAATRVFVVGSCVSRDAFNGASDALQLVRYVARSSLASALHSQQAPAELARVPAALKSKWQQRMVSFDLEKRLPALLARDDYDLLLLDLIDERFPVTIFDGVPVTVSTEFKHGYGDVSALHRMGAGDPKRLHLWRQGVQALLRRISPERVVLNKVYWASRNAEGEMLPNQAKIRVNNEQLDLMYRDICSIGGVRVIDYAPELLVADPEHRWGSSPYHYMPSVYAHTVACLRCISIPS